MVKTITVIGSAIALDVAHYLPVEKYEIKGNFLSISPASFVKCELKTKLKVENISKESCQVDLNKSFFKEIKKINSDIVLIDLLDCRLDVNEYVYKEERFTATKNLSLLELMKSHEFSPIDYFDPFSASEQSWYDILKTYIDKLLLIYPAKNIFVLDVKSANAYLSKNNNYYKFISESEAAKQSLFYNMLYSLLNRIAPNLSYIKSPEIFYCEETVNKKTFTFRLQKSYYQYAAEAIEYIDNGQSKDDISLLCEKCQLNSLQKIAKLELKEKKWENIRLNNFEGIYDDDFGNYINTNGSIVTITLNGQNNKIEIGKNCKISNLSIALCDTNKISIGDNNIFDDACIMTIGKNNDIQLLSGNYFKKLLIGIKNRNTIAISKNNIFRSGVEIRMENNCKYAVGLENKIINLMFLMFDDSELQIGNHNAFYSNDSEFRCHSYTSLIIRNNTLWSLGISVLNGDGHSIFDCVTKEKVNDMRRVPENKRTIIVNDHVWVGKRAMILNGADIGEGCVVGANSLVKKKTPNNCIVAGNPAKIIRNNICWCFDGETENISKCEPYDNMTIIEKI